MTFSNIAMTCGPFKLVIHGPLSSRRPLECRNICGIWRSCSTLGRLRGWTWQGNQPNGLAVAILNHINIYGKIGKEQKLYSIHVLFREFQEDSLHVSNLEGVAHLCWFTKKFWIFRTFGEAFMSHIDQLHGNSCKSPQLWLINNDMICQNKAQLSTVFPRSSSGPSCNNAAMTSAKSWP